MPFFGLASTWAKAAAFLSIAALALQAVGYGTNYWMARYTVRDKVNIGVGLWKMTDCSGSYNAPCTDSDIPTNYLNNTVTIVRALEAITLALIFICAVCLIFYVGSRRSRTFGMAVTLIIMLFITAALGIAGMAVWVVQIPEFHYPSWSFGLTVVAITLIITAAVTLIPDIIENNYRDLLKVGGHYDNLAVTSEEGKPMTAGGAGDFRDDVKPIIESQGPKGAPVFQYLNYDKRKKQDGF